MTIKAVEWALKREGITSAAKLVLVMLCDCINAKDEFAFPSQRRIAEVVGRQERQVRRHLAALVDAELIDITPGVGLGRGRGRSADRYRLACNHLTGEDRPLDGVKIAQCGTVTGGHSSPAATITGGQKEQSVSVTGGHLRPLQADISGAAYIEEPEEEPELPLQDREEPSTLAAAKPRAKLDGKRALELYNAAAERAGWCAIKDLSKVSDARKQMVRARLRDHGMEGWEAQIALAEEMPFLAGQNDRGWRMGIDYFARPSGWAKIEEGAFPRTRKVSEQLVTHEDAVHRAARSYFNLKGRWPPGYHPPQGATP